MGERGGSCYRGRVTGRRVTNTGPIASAPVVHRGARRPVPAAPRSHSCEPLLYDGMVAQSVKKEGVRTLYIPETRDYVELTLQGF